MLRQVAAANLTIGEAAAALGVSADTLRRWDRDGKLETVRDERNRRLVPRTEVERLSARPRRHRTGAALSARNRFTGVVRSAEVKMRIRTSAASGTSAVGARFAAFTA